MNTGKQINAMVAVLFLTLIVVGAYTIWDPFRSVDAEDAQLEKSANFGAELYERNCRLCHGDRGEGGVDGGRFAAALALDRDDLQGIDNGTFSAALKADAYDLVTNTITCGRVGTQMPTWGEDHGGTMNDEQIRQLAILITEGRWDLAEHHADHTDEIATGHAHVEAEDGTFSADETELAVSNAGLFTLGQYIRIGEERLRVLPNQILVERGIDGTTAAEHGLGTPILVDGEPVLRNQSPTLRGGQIILLGGAAESLAGEIDVDDTALVVGDTTGFEEGDIIQLEDERMRVTGTATGLPSTGALLAKDIRREPTKLLLSKPADISEGDLIRLGAEPMEVTEVGEAGADVRLDDDTAADSVVVSVKDPRFLRRGYQFRVGDEWIEVIDAVSTGQTVDATFGKAQSLVAVSGTQGIEEGMLLRVDDELMRVTEIVRPARMQLSRGQDGTTASSHAAGTELLRAADEDAEDQTPTPSGQAIAEDLSTDGYVVALTSTTRINVGDPYVLDGETVRVLATDPAVLRVERGVQDTEKAEHGRRAPIFVGNNLNVIRGINGTTPADHSEGDEIVLAQLGVDRAVGVKPLEHAKNAEVLLGNLLTVERAVLGTEAEDHADHATVRNFPEAPDSAPTTGTGRSICGQSPAAEAPPPGGPTPTPVEGEQAVAVVMDEFSIELDPESGAAGAFGFAIQNVGGAVHNFRLISTDLPADELPTSGPTVDEDSLDVIASSSGNISAGGTQSVSAMLESGPYVVICNVPAHYQQGMYAAFTVE